MKWVDTHCHLQLDERPASDLLERADNVSWVVAPGVDLATSQASLQLAATYPGEVLGTAGLHPHDARKWEAEGDLIADLAGNASAIGETGLDYYRELSPRPVQRQSFGEQIALAADRGLPLIVHCRDAFSDVYEMLEGRPGVNPVVLHCWTGGRRWTRRFLDIGVYFSFAGPIAFDTGETIRLAADLVPPDRALVETDTPYLAPPPHRGEANEPAWVALVGEALADVWGVPADEVATTTTATATRLFKGDSGAEQG